MTSQPKLTTMCVSMVLLAVPVMFATAQDTGTPSNESLSDCIPLAKIEAIGSEIVI